MSEPYPFPPPRRFRAIAGKSADGVSQLRFAVMGCTCPGDKTRVVFFNRHGNYPFLVDLDLLQDIEWIDPEEKVR